MFGSAIFVTSTYFLGLKLQRNEKQSVFMKQVASRHISLKCPFGIKRTNRDRKEVKKVAALMTELGIQKCFH